MNLQELIYKAGGAQKVADASGIARQSVYEWIERGRLPRTEWTGETHYSVKIRELLESNGIELMTSEILEIGK